MKKLLFAFALLLSSTSLLNAQIETFDLSTYKCELRVEKKTHKCNGQPTKYMNKQAVCRTNFRRSLNARFLL